MANMPKKTKLYSRFLKIVEMFVQREIRKEIFSHEPSTVAILKISSDETLKSPLLKKKIKVCRTDLISCESRE